MRPLRVFLCHASQDKPAVRKLHRYLKQRGVQPWLDELDLLPGENWEVEIPNAIFSSDVILVCLSKNSVDKEGYVQKEIIFALDKAMEKPEGTIFVVPVKLEDCDVPKRLNRFQWVDVSRPDGYKRLMLGLQKRASGLGADVSSVVLDETRRTPKPEKKKSEEQIAPVSAPSEEEVKEEPKREIPVQPKPFTKLLDPSSLSPKGTSTPQDSEKVTEPKIKPALIFNPRLLGIGGIILLVLIVSGFGLNYLVNNQPIPNSTPSPTLTSEPPAPTIFTSTPQPAKNPTSTLTPVIVISEKDGMTLVYVPEGEFVMGGDSGDDNEKPVHMVDLDAFWVDQTEVTNAMYAKCVESGKCDPPSVPSYFSFGDSKYSNHPVVYVDWNDANAYCSWAGRRLPTEAEWEKAARGTDGRTYPWGEEIDCDKANYARCVLATSPVKSYPSGVSPSGAYDMAGNVWEWVKDWYDAAYYQNSPSFNPQGLDTGSARVLRGGAWGLDDSNVHSANRGWNSPTNTSSNIGFRCARSP